MAIASCARESARLIQLASLLCNADQLPVVGTLPAVCTQLIRSIDHKRGRMLRFG
jgi:hypothetical protein